MARKPVLNPREERRYRTLNTVMRLLDVKDSTLSEQMGEGYSRSGIYQYRHGDTRLRDNHLEDFAAALELPVDVFDMDPLDAANWVLNNLPDRIFAASGWLSAA